MARATGLGGQEHRFRHSVAAQVMDATGTYHEQLATYLHKAGAQVSVVNPAQVKFYTQSLGVRRIIGGK